MKEAFSFSSQTPRPDTRAVYCAKTAIANVLLSFAEKLYLRRYTRHSREGEQYWAIGDQDWRVHPTAHQSIYAKQVRAGNTGRGASADYRPRLLCPAYP